MKKLIMSFLFLLIVTSSYSTNLQNSTQKLDSFKIAYSNIQIANQISLDLIGTKKEIYLMQIRYNNLEKTKDFYKRSAEKSIKSDSLCSEIVLRQTKQLKNDTILIRNLENLYKDANKQANKGRITTIILGVATPILTIAAFIAGVFIAK